ncbi:MAG: inverse autotransporter beta domain-containing protein [Verrucomicrobia bacterium]|nr:inverse autotransporter beta domain-containing protein [Verrucomicrobiota bacterium]
MRYKILTSLAATSLLLSAPPKKSGLPPNRDPPARSSSSVTEETAPPLLSFPANISEPESISIAEKKAPSPCPSVEKRSDHNSSYWIKMRNQEGNGVGYNQGYSSLDFFASPTNGWKGLFPFLDLRGHIFNNGKWAANAGAGVRWVGGHHVYGVNAFYDYRRPPHHYTYQQVGGGLEFLSENWSARLNGYFPISARKHHLHTGFHHFEGHHAIFRRRSEFSFIGGDLELEKKLWNKSWFALDGLVKGYYFAGKFDKKAVGGMLGLNAAFTRYITVQGRMSYDSFFHFRGSGELSLHIPLGSTRILQKNLCPTERIALEKRLIEPVERFEIIPIGHHTQKSPALDPTTGDPLHFVFVDNARGSSDGSYENPYPTLIEAQNNSSPGDVIYVFAGDGTSKGMDQGILLKSGQRFIGSGIAHEFITKFGSLPVYAQTSMLPTVTAPSIVIVSADNTEISGFNIEDNIIGIRVPSTNVLITHNVISRLGNNIAAGIEIQDGAKGITIRDNVIQELSSVGTAFGIIVNLTGTQISDLTIERNTIRHLTGADPAGIGFVLNSGNPASFISATVRSNTIQSSKMGIDIVQTMASNSSLVIENNLVQQNGSSGLLARNNSSGFMNIALSGNVFENNGNVFGASIEIENLNTGTSLAKLVGNSCDNGPSAYQLKQTNGTFDFQSPVENNVGTIKTNGIINIIQ